MSWGDFFHSFLFRYVLPHSNYFHILILALFSLFQIFKWIWWRKKKYFFWTGTRCAQTDMNVDRKKKLPGWTLLSHSDVLQEIWKTFSAVVHSKIVFFFSFFSYARAGSCQIILISFFLYQTLLCLMINCTCVPYRKVSWLNINTGFSSVLLFGSCISILSDGTNGRKRMRRSNSIESRVFYFVFFFKKGTEDCVYTLESDFGKFDLSEDESPIP